MILYGFCVFQSGSSSTNSSSTATSEHTVSVQSTVTGATLPAGVTWTTAGYVDTLPTATSPAAYPSLYLQVCRESQRGVCTRQPSECRYAHPPDNVAVDATDNTVTVCMDFVKGKCVRESCRYFHPPPHLLAQVKVVQQRVAAVSGGGGTSGAGALNPSVTTAPPPAPAGATAPAMQPQPSALTPAANVSQQNQAQQPQHLPQAQLVSS